MTSLQIIMLIKIKFLLICILIACLFIIPINSTEPEKLIALTFDDGPHKKYTPEILDILSEYGVKATFFVIGKNCERFPEIFRRELDEGHEVGNHTYSHPDIDKLSYNELMQELLATDETLIEIRGYKPRLFRLPGGKKNPQIEKIIIRLNYISVSWNVDTRDWKALPSQEISREILNKIKPGYIVLMHDYVVGKSGTPEALRTVIPALLEQGYKFVTVSELLDYKNLPDE